MELILTRIAKKKDYTIGRLQIPPPAPSRAGGEAGHQQTLNQISQGKELSELPSRAGGAGGGYFCDTLEPIWRDYQNGQRKIKGRSAIPEGRYAVVISYSPKFKAWLPILLGVPNFSGIRIHAGNTAKDTEGCILVGRNRLVGQLVDSRDCLRRLKQLIVEAKERGEPVWITVR